MIFIGVLMVIIGWVGELDIEDSFSDEEFELVQRNSRDDKKYPFSKVNAIKMFNVSRIVGVVLVIIVFSFKI